MLGILYEYSALCCAESISFDQTIKLLKYRGEAMQNAFPTGEGGMMAILGESVDKIKRFLKEKEDNLSCYIANDNSNGQIVISGKAKDLKLFENELKKINIKYVNLPVSAPFHCPLMVNATQQMRAIQETEFKNQIISIISNVTAKPLNDSEIIKL